MAWIDPKICQVSQAPYTCQVTLSITHWMEHNITPYEKFLDHIDNNLYSFYRHYKNYIKLLHQFASLSSKASAKLYLFSLVFNLIMKPNFAYFLYSSIINLRSRSLSFVQAQVVSLEDVNQQS